MPIARSASESRSLPIRNSQESQRQGRLVSEGRHDRKKPRGKPCVRDLAGMRGVLRQPSSPGDGGMRLSPGDETRTPIPHRTAGAALRRRAPAPLPGKPASGIRRHLRRHPHPAAGPQATDGVDHRAGACPRPRVAAGRSRSWRPARKASRLLRPPEEAARSSHAPCPSRGQAQHQTYPNRWPLRRRRGRNGASRIGRHGRHRHAMSPRRTRRTPRPITHRNSISGPPRRTPLRTGKVGFTLPKVLGVIASPGLLICLVAPAVPRGLDGCACSAHIMTRK